MSTAAAQLTLSTPIVNGFDAARPRVEEEHNARELLASTSRTRPLGRDAAADAQPHQRRWLPRQW